MTGRRQPRMTPESFMSKDPLADAVMTDTLGLAGDLEKVLAELQTYDHSSISAILFKKPAGRSGSSGSYQWLDRLSPPFNFDQMVIDLRERFGGGEYRVTIVAGGKPRKQVEFQIYGPPKEAGAATTGEPPMNSMMTAMLAMEEKRQARDDENRRRDREERNDRENAMWKAAAIIVPVVAPLMLGGREKMSDLIAMMHANKPEQTSLKDNIETLVLLKKVFGDDNKSLDGFDPDDIWGSLARSAGPIAAAAGRAFGAGRNGGAPAGPAETPQAEHQLFLPPAAAIPAGTPLQFNPATAAPALTGVPVLDALRPHVLYFFSARLAPDLAAEAIADIMQRNGVTENDFNGLVAAVSGSPDWQADLAGWGIDLRADPQWADDFLAELVAAWAERDKPDGISPGGPAGGGDDAAGNEQMGPARQDAPPGEGNGGQPGN